ncbi:MAG TPA: hypothetical protein PLV06_06230 [Bacteroidales bacterium]|nr:hypothetical protein [Bacteroidales bacterium]HPJ60428.1 hypothetical protein [Bacteroidales bacterium]HPR11966.1 hypothetical protein [Bacteroidales bacterium]HRW85742.1 hypothetical protein [Bacteroidales bacterium]
MVIKRSILSDAAFLAFKIAGAVAAGLYDLKMQSSGSNAGDIMIHSYLRLRFNP